MWPVLLYNLNNFADTFVKLQDVTFNRLQHSVGQRPKLSHGGRLGEIKGRHGGVR